MVRQQFEVVTQRSKFGGPSVVSTQLLELVRYTVCVHPLVFFSTPRAQNGSADVQQTVSFESRQATY